MVHKFYMLSIYLLFSIHQVASIIHPEVLTKLKETKSVDILVEFADGNKWHQTHRSLLEESDENLPASRGERLEKIVNSLTKASQHSQASVATMLSNTVQDFTVSKNANMNKTKHYESFRSFFIINSMSVVGADRHIIEQIAADPSVKSIALDFELDIADPQENYQVSSMQNLTNSMRYESLGYDNHFWHIEQTGVKNLWEKGYKGRGVVVGSIDSGVMSSHSILYFKQQAGYGWHDPSGVSTSTPVDRSGHGTHTIGTMVGDYGYGVAPNAEYAACTTAGTKNGKPVGRYILACMEYMTCPWHPITKKKDCSKAPHVINNSWGIPRVKIRDPISDLDKPIALWRKNGIIPVFAAGNYRKNLTCGSVSYPAELPNVIAVGATDISNDLAEFSSTGPTIKGLMKPDITAPGHGIWSAAIGGFGTSVARASGTSMASPFVAGVIALWLSKDPSLTYDQVFQKLTEFANHRVVALNETCSDGKDESKFTFPNNMYGHGLVDPNAIFKTPAPTPAPSKSVQTGAGVHLSHSLLLHVSVFAAVICYVN